MGNTVDMKGKYVPEPKPTPEPVIKPRLNDAQVFFLILAMLMLLAGLTGWFLYEIPAAAHAETVHQRAVAAGSWRHVPDWQDYAAFVEKNQ